MHLREHPRLPFPRHVLDSLIIIGRRRKSTPPRICTQCVDCGLGTNTADEYPYMGPRRSLGTGMDRSP